MWSAWVNKDIENLIKYTGWFSKRFEKKKNGFEMGTTRSRLFVDVPPRHERVVLGRLLVEEQGESSLLGEGPNILRKRDKRVPSVSSQESTT